MTQWDVVTQVPVSGYISMPRVATYISNSLATYISNSPVKWALYKRLPVPPSPTRNSLNKTCSSLPVWSYNFFSITKY